MEKPKIEKIMDIAAKRGFFYPSAEIYGSKAGFWDFGPVGATVRRKIINFWRHEFVQKENILEIHGSQILPISVFEGSGHLKSFTDPIVQCLKCKKFDRADNILSEKLKTVVPEGLPVEKYDDMIKKTKIKCQRCGGELGRVSKFNMMVETIVGKQNEHKTFLRPEACQSIFLNFARMVKTMRLTLPQGIAQAGGAFRNEISPRQSITRAIEFSQMEAEIFFDPENDIKDLGDVKNYNIRILFRGKEKVEEISCADLVRKKIVPFKLIAYYLARTQQMWNKLGIPLENLRFREVGKDEKAFYSLLTLDFEVNTGLGWLELIANNYRTDYDLKNHMEYSGTNLEYNVDGKKIVPHIWEISAGVDRTMFALLDNSLKEGKEGPYFSLNPVIAPYDCAVFPLVNRNNIPDLSKKILTKLREDWFEVFYDDSASIGRRYARADEIGVPFCITVDSDSIQKNDVTIRHRDTTKQIRVKIKDLNEILGRLLTGENLSKFGKFIN